jgi:hypothetical protein
MQRQRDRQTGFGAVVIVLVVVVVGVIIATGALVYQRQRASLSGITANTTQPTGQHQSSQQQTTSDVYASWKTYCDSVYHYCFKYPQDWTLTVNSTPTTYCESGQVSLAAPSNTAGVSYTNDDPHDAGVLTYYPVSVTAVPAANQAVSIVGGYLTADNRPQYQIVDNATLAAYALAIGQPAPFLNNAMFTDKDTGTHTCLGSLRAGPFTRIASATDAQAWFNTGDAKTSLLILKSFSYQPNQ